ncbi:putative epoxide hydrolase [Colletotrichum kahawae]|uniref:Epoxide hydrolase n=1 Tax=Colletotrichum kahawae TaxID=34407 RepID=A0AAD9YII1_COLKA|nr:putative epoxide hydrolase [Colletotrichum kahawae]
MRGLRSFQGRHFPALEDPRAMLAGSEEFVANVKSMIHADGRTPGIRQISAIASVEGHNNVEASQLASMTS